MSKQEDPILEIIKKRRTVKKFLRNNVEFEKIQKIIDAGMWAPSAGNVQPWKFIVVQNQDKKEGIEKAAFHQEWLSSAPVLVVVCAIVDKSKRYYGVRGERLYVVQDCAASIQNMLLEATSLGVGSAWVGAFDETELKRVIDIPDEARPQAIIAFGYSDGIVVAPPKKELSSCLYFEKYGEKEIKRKTLFPLGDHLKNANKSVKQKIEDIKSKLLRKQ